MTTQNFSLKRSNHRDSDFQKLIVELDTYLAERYQDYQNKYNPLNATDVNFRIVIAYDKDLPVCCATIRHIDKTTTELKRMFVKESYRGSGVAKLVCNELEAWAKELGYKNIILDTGIYQPEAIRFYEKMNYKQIPNYGDYIDDELIICMQKELS